MEYHIDDLTISKEKWQDIILAGLFFLSFINKITILLLLITSLYLLQQKEVGAVKGIFILTLRSVMNPGVATTFGAYQSLKLIIMMFLSIYLIVNYKKIKLKENEKLKPIIITVFIFMVYNIIISLYISSLPIIGMFKSLSYSIVFLGVISGTGITIDKFNLYEWILNWYKILVVLSFLMIPTSQAYLVNGRGLQGIFNHPNLFGVVLVLFMAMLLGSKDTNNKKWYFILSFYMILLSQSRTSLLSVLVIIIIYLLFDSLRKITYKKIFIGIVMFFVIMALSGFIKEYFMDFIAKGQELDNILYSRETQLNMWSSSILNNPLLGNGFGVPILPYRLWTFSLDYFVEPGNLIIAIMAYSGIIGTTFFAVYMIQILFFNKDNFKRKIYLYMAPFLISMGEMVFFSSNSIGPLLYLLFGIYMFYDFEEKEKIDYNG